MAALEEQPNLNQTQASEPAGQAGNFLPSEALSHTYVGRLDSILESPVPLSAGELKKIGEEIGELHERYGSGLVPVPRSDGSILFFAAPEAYSAHEEKAAEQLLGKLAIGPAEQNKSENGA